MKDLTNKQREYLTQIIEWIYNQKFETDEFKIAFTDYEITDWAAYDLDTALSVGETTYKVSMIKWVIEVVLRDGRYNDGFIEYLNALKPLYRHIKNRKNA